MPASKRLGQRTISRHRHFKMAKVGQVFMTINEQHRVELDRHDEVVQMWIFAKHFTWLTHPRKQLVHLEFIVPLLATVLQRRICLLPHTTTVKGPRDCRVITTLAQPATSVSRRSPARSHTCYALPSECLRRKPMTRKYSDTGP